jgi:hypothetical protein
MRKTIILLFIFISFFINCSKQNNLNQIEWIDFQWVDYTIGDRYFEKAAMNIPFRIDNIPLQFNCQFDLGANKSCLYGNVMDPYLSAYPELASKYRDLNKNFSHGRQYGFLKNISFMLDSVLFKSKKLLYWKGYGEKYNIDSVYTKTEKHIGTIGVDIFLDKILIIDFPNQRLATIKSLPVKYSNNVTYVDAIIKNGRVIIPITLEGEKYQVLYDSGSSMFYLFIPMANWGLFFDKSQKVDTLEITAWGKRFDIYGGIKDYNVIIGNCKMNGKHIYASSKKEYIQFMRQNKVDGIIGNALFFDKQIIIDYKKKRFGIITNANNKYI